jgi:hypothetical protein
MHQKAFEAKAVDFEIGAVRHCSQQLDRDVVGAVRGDRQVEGFGQMGDLEKTQ